METISQLHLAHRQSLVSEAQQTSLYAAAEELARMLSGLRSRLKRPTQS
jgi:four helix bundle protein